MPQRLVPDSLWELVPGVPESRGLGCRFWTRSFHQTTDLREHAERRRPPRPGAARRGAGVGPQQR